MSPAIENAAARLVALAAAAGKTVATAESCTGGMVATAITSAPGSSAVFEFGAVTYSNRIKTQILGVPEEILGADGAVSERCARAMAEGARRVSGADFAVAVTGIAGPGGGSQEKPVGLVHFAVASAAGTFPDSALFTGDRASVREKAAMHAVGLLTAAVAPA